jgi:hypothetical protein
MVLDVLKEQSGVDCLIKAVLLGGVSVDNDKITVDGKFGEGVQMVDGCKEASLVQGGEVGIIPVCWGGGVQVGCGVFDYNGSLRWIRQGR